MRRCAGSAGALAGIIGVPEGRRPDGITHGICPECAEKLYHDYNPYKKRKPGQT